MTELDASERPVATPSETAATNTWNIKFLLLLLLEEPTYGSELSRRLKALNIPGVGMAPSNITSTLQRLEAAGIVEASQYPATKIATGGPPPSLAYSLSEAGIETLRRELAISDAFSNRGRQRIPRSDLETINTNPLPLGVKVNNIEDRLAKVEEQLQDQDRILKNLC